MINSEKTTIARQNEAMRALLSTHSVAAQFENLEVDPVITSSDLNMFGSASLDIRDDPEIGHTRVFADIDFGDLSDLTWTSSDTSQAGEATGLHPVKRETPVAGDSWAALDVSGSPSYLNFSS
jgi:hypothetical protein